MVGFLWSTVLLWHGTFAVNSLAHVMGRRRYATSDTSRNSALIALWTLGEGWHNNHHHFPASARQGFYWYEFDVTYSVLKALSYVGLVRDLKVPSKTVMDAARVRDGSFDEGMFRKHWAKAQAAMNAARHLDEEKVRTHRAALEEYLASSLRSAEALAKLNRQQQRAAALTAGE